MKILICAIHLFAGDRKISLNIQRIISGFIYVLLINNTAWYQLFLVYKKVDKVRKTRSIK